jgi:K(+)-stimulated pyrophosphate-energized sodium pump
MSIVSLVIAPSLAQLHKTEAGSSMQKTMEIKVNATSTDSSKSATTVTISGDDNKLLVNAIKKDGYAVDGNLTIELKDSKLTINDKQLDSVTASKYAPFLKGREKQHITIKMNESKN